MFRHSTAGALASDVSARPVSPTRCEVEALIGPVAVWIEEPHAGPSGAVTFRPTQVVTLKQLRALAEMFGSDEIDCFHGREDGAEAEAGEVTIFYPAPEATPEPPASGTLPIVPSLKEVRASYGPTRNACFGAAYVALREATKAADDVPTLSEYAAAYVAAVATVVPPSKGLKWPGRAGAMRAAIKAKAPWMSPAAGDRINVIARRVWVAEAATVEVAS